MSGTLINAGSVHISEIPGVLQAISQALNIGDIHDRTLGSVGKKQFSGDIDIAMDDYDKNEKAAFLQKLETTSVFSQIRNGATVSTLVKIPNFNPELKGSLRPRTGFVQVDFMFGNVAAMKLQYHSPHETNSAYGGVHRTMLLATVASIYGQRQISETEVERYKLSPKQGLVKIVRRTFGKKMVDEVIGGPWTKPGDVALELNLGNDPEILDSFENLWAAIKKNYSPELVAKIKASYSESLARDGLNVPTQLAEQRVGFRSFIAESVDGPRIAHPEDIMFQYGVEAGVSAIIQMRSLDANTTIKWDGSPAVKIGRLNDGSLLFLPKHLFGKAQPKTANELYDLLMSSKNSGAPGFKDYALKMAHAAEVANNSIHKDYRGVMAGDMLYFSTPSVVDGHVVFEPNTVTYSVPTRTRLGARILKSEIGIVIHGEDSLPETGEKLLLFKPTYVSRTNAKDIEYQDGEMKDIIRMMRSRKDLLEAMLGDFNETQKKYFRDFLNFKVDEFGNSEWNPHSHNAPTYAKIAISEFKAWLAAKLSDRQWKSMLDILSKHAEALELAWNITLRIIRLKHNIVDSLDANQVKVIQSMGDYKTGEGYVIGGGDRLVKLVNRGIFSKLNRDRHRK